LPTEEAVIRNPIGANMSFRRSVFTKAGLFSENLGRIGTVPVGCEETELSIRANRSFPHGRILHQPRSAVRHAVTQDRTTFAYFRRRCWSEGVSKAIVSRRTTGKSPLATERRYVFSTLRRALFRELRGALSGDTGGLLRAAVVVAGVCLTTAGYVSRPHVVGEP
jgi:hypothetical protein